MAQELGAGAAKADITPTRPVMLGGYSSRTNLSQGVHDPLSARVVAFERDGKHLVLISLDLLGFYNDTAEPLRQAILAGAHLQPSELFLCAIHTHSAPIPALTSEKVHPNNVEYTRELQGKLVDATRRALAAIAPARLELGLGFSPVGSNRRQVVPDTNGATKIILGRNPFQPIDREVQVLKVSRLDRGETMGIVFTGPTHSTSLGPKNFLVSGDVHGLAAQFLEKYLGGNTISAPFASASGNIDPWYRVLPGFNTTNGWIPEPILLGTLLGEEVGHVLAESLKPAAGGPIKTAIKTIQLPGKARNSAASVAGTPETPLVITAGRVGDTAFVGLGGEVFNEIGQAIKKASPFAQTFVFTHCNGAAGYLPIRAAYPEGGYEVQSSAFAAGADERVVEEVKSLLAELRNY